MQSQPKAYKRNIVLSLMKAKVKKYIETEWNISTVPGNFVNFSQTSLNFLAEVSWWNVHIKMGHY